MHVSDGIRTHDTGVNRGKRTRWNMLTVWAIEVLAAITMRSTVFGGAALYSPAEIYWHFSETLRG
jgi:hypothetical protein